MIYLNEVVCPGDTYGVTPDAINNAGQIVGACSDSYSGKGFLYDLSNPSQRIIYFEQGVPRDINDAGWVVGGDGERVAYLFINGTTYNLFDLLPSEAGIKTLTPMAINNQGQIAGSSNLGGVLLTPID